MRAGHLVLFTAFSRDQVRNILSLLIPQLGRNSITASTLNVTISVKIATTLCMFIQEEKVYVQHLVRENAKLLWDIIANKNACFYIAG